MHIHGLNLFRPENRNGNVVRNLNLDSSEVDNLVSNSGEFSDVDKSLTQMLGLSRALKHAKSDNPILNLSQLFPNLNLLQQQVSFYKKQFDNLISNNWILSKDEIHGISSYYCKSCSTFSLRLIVDPEYDMTMQAKHRCGDEKVIGSNIVFKIQHDITNIDERTTEILLNLLNSCMPGSKYLIAHDISDIFDGLDRKFNYESVKTLLGIPDRVYLYSLESDYKVVWIDRVLMNMPSKIVLEDSEIRDFLRRVKSTYAIFEIPVESTLKHVYMKFTS